MELTEKQEILQYLDQTLSSGSAKMVGKILKRIELIEPEDSPENKTELLRLRLLKKELKELIYETFREIRDIFNAYTFGLEGSQMKFIKKEEGK